MALPPSKPTDQSDVFLREVDEDFRREQLKSLWDRYGRGLITLVSLLLIATAGYLFWLNMRANRIDEQADRYVGAIESLDKGEDAKARPVLLALAKEGSPGYRALSQLDLAALAVRDGKKDEARTVYQQLAKDSAVPQPFRDFASLRAIMLDYDGMKAADAIARLKPLTQETSPWFGTAGELTAVAYLRDGKQKEARELFEAIQRNESVALTARARAQEMARMLGSADSALKKIEGLQ